jgi:uncharacterized membrane protein
MQRSADPGRTDAMASTAPNSAAPRSVKDNIDAVVGAEEALTASRGRGERIGEAVAATAGTPAFLVAQVAAVLGWVVVNAGLVSGVPAFDPFPYSLGGALLSLEGVLLACFVLTKQAHEGRLSERRSHLNLQANLLVEQEVTKLIQMMHRTSAVEGTEASVVDAEVRELGQVTAVGELAQKLDRRLGQGERPRA